MAKEYKKKDSNTLEVTVTINEKHVIQISRTELQTELDHKELDKTILQKEIDSVKAKIAILDA